VRRRIRPARSVERWLLMIAHSDHPVEEARVRRWAEAAQRAGVGGRRVRARLPRPAAARDDRRRPSPSQRRQAYAAHVALGFAGRVWPVLAGGGQVLRRSRCLQDGRGGQPARFPGVRDPAAAPARRAHRTRHPRPHDGPLRGAPRESHGRSGDAAPLPARTGLLEVCRSAHDGARAISQRDPPARRRRSPRGRGDEQRRPAALPPAGVFT